jgi:RNA polymerase sigma factor (TIGR02999 family)
VPDDSPPAPDITLLLQKAGTGQPGADDALLEAIYGQLRRLAQHSLAGDAAPTLQATELVHEAWLRLNPGGAEIPWENRRHFFSAAAESMRRILIDHARARGAQKRGGKLARVPLTDVMDLVQAPDSSLILHLDDALTRLSEDSPDSAEIVRLRFFAGLTVDETAALTSHSRSTVLRKWQFARAWLFQELFGAEPPAASD